MSAAQVQDDGIGLRTAVVAAGAGVHGARNRPRPAGPPHRRTRKDRVMITAIASRPLSSYSDAHRELVAFVLGAADLLGIEVCGLRVDVGRTYLGGWDGDVAVHISTDRTDFRTDAAAVDRLADYLGLPQRGTLQPTVYVRDTDFTDPRTPLGGFEGGVRLSAFCGRPGTEKRQ